MRISLARYGSTWSVLTCALALAAGCGRANDAAFDSDGSSHDMLEPGAVEASAAPCGADGVARGHLTVNNQAEVDALLGCQRIEGSLSLLVPEGTDTSPLSTLSTITGQLEVVGSGAHPALALDGFRGLEVVGGLHLRNLTVGDLSGFATLRTILPAPEAPALAAPELDVPPDPSSPDGTLAIVYCEGLTSLAGLDALEQVAHIGVDTSSLTSLAGAPRLQGLRSLYSSNCPLGDLSGLDTSSLEHVSVTGSEITSLAGLGAPTALRTLELASNPRLTQLTDWQPPPRLDSLDLTGNGALESARGLEALRAVGVLRLWGAALPTADFVSLRGLEGLERAEQLWIKGLGRLPHLTGLDGLREVDDLRIEETAALIDLAGLSSLTSVGRMGLQPNDSLASLAGLASPTIDDLEIAYVSIVDLRGLEQATIARSLVLARLQHLQSLDGLPRLATGADLSVSESAALDGLGALEASNALGYLAFQTTGITGLDALANLRQLGGLMLYDNPRLEQIDGIGGLESLGSLQMRGSPLVFRLPAFESMTEACADCPRFSLGVSLDALESLGPWPWLEDASSLSFTDNPALTRVSLPALRSVGDLVFANNPALGELLLPALSDAPSIKNTGTPGIVDVIRDVRERRR